MAMSYKRMLIVKTINKNKHRETGPYEVGMAREGQTAATSTYSQRRFEGKQ